MRNKIKLLLKRLLSLLPSRLPVGMTEFNKFSSEIIELSGKFADEDSMRFAIASQLLHLGPQTSSVAKNHFVRSLRKAAANQVASQVFQDIKLKQQAAEKALNDAKTQTQKEAQQTS